MDINVLLSLLNGASPDARGQGLAQAIQARMSGTDTIPAPEDSRGRGIAQLALLSGDPVLGQFGAAQLRDVSAREERGAEQQKYRLTAALQALKDQQTAEERRLDNARADASQAETRRFHQWQMDNPSLQPVTAQGGQIVGFNPRTATTTPVSGPGGGVLQKDKPLEQGVSKELTALDQELRNIGDVRSAFKPEYAGGGPAGRALTAGAQLLGGLAPEKAGSLAPQLSQEAGNFWSKFDMLVTLPQRNALFGASLTPGEKASFEGAMRIKPGNSPDTIRKALADMEAIAHSKLDSHTAALRQEGYNPGAIEALTQHAAPAAPVRKVIKGKVYEKTADGWEAL